VIGRGAWTAALFLYRMSLQSNEDGYFPAPKDLRATFKRRSSRFAIFSLGRTVVIIDNAASQKLRFLAEMTYPEDADSRDGDDDPV
jgi:hypothetical protein